MISWIIAALAIWIAFLIYLTMTDQRVRYHDQNLTDGKGPLWRHGRAWWLIETRDTEHWRHGPGARLEWSVGRDSHFAVEVTILDDEGDDIQIGLGVPWLFRCWLTLTHLPLLNRIPYKWRRNFGYQTGLKIYSGAIWIQVLHAEMWGAAPVWRRSPSWISLWKSVGYKEYRGVGFYISFSFDSLIFGGYERMEMNIGDPIIAEIPIEPDNSLGMYYVATFQRQEEVRWRSNFPWRKRRNTYWEISTDHPPLHAGKGENSYDQDDDGIFGCSVDGETIQEAIDAYRAKCLRDRERYGLPDAVVTAFWTGEDKRIEENIRAVLRGEYQQTIGICADYYHLGPFVTLHGRSQCVACGAFLDSKP